MGCCSLFVTSEIAQGSRCEDELMAGHCRTTWEQFDCARYLVDDIK